MTKVFPIGHIVGLKISARPSAFIGLLILWLLISSAGYWLLGFHLGSALAGGFVAACLHYLSELWHNISHAIAARKTGYPMTGTVFWWFLATAHYPYNEGNLPAKIHIQRALGGPAGSLALSILLTTFALILRPAGSLIWWLVVFFAADNFFIFTLGSLLPLGFTDGSTILYWKGKRDRE